MGGKPFRQSLAIRRVAPRLCCGVTQLTSAITRMDIVRILRERRLIALAWLALIWNERRALVIGRDYEAVIAWYRVVR